MPVWSICLLSLVGLGLVVYLGGLYMFRSGFTWDGDPMVTQRHTLDRMRRGPLAQRAQMVEQGPEWIDGQPCREMFITSRDGLRLRARYFAASQPNGRVLLLAHGFHSRGSFDFGCGCPFYLGLGYDLLMIDQRAHGQSEGRYICFGALESRDVLDWCAALIRENPTRPIVLGGISMGATSVLLAAGSGELPPQVIGVVADCGFTDCEGEFRHVLRQRHLPAWPLLPVAQLICRRRLGFGFSQHSTLEAVKRLPVPVIFFHGENDGFVPAENSRRNFAACQAPYKELVLVAGADHGQSFVVDEARCRERLTAFFNGLIQPQFSPTEQEQAHD